MATWTYILSYMLFLKCDINILHQEVYFPYSWTYADL